MSASQTTRSGAFNWIVGKYGDLIPLLAFLAVVTFVYFYDNEKAGDLEQERTEQRAMADRRAGFVADQLGNAISQRQGAMATGELQFSPVEDSISQRTLRAVLDTITNRYQGFTISAVYPSGRVSKGSNAVLGSPGFQLDTDTALQRAYDRAQTTGNATATAVVSTGSTRRVFIIDPVVRNARAVGYLVAELDPGVIYRNVIADPEVSDSLAARPPTYYAAYGPNRTLI